MHVPVIQLEASGSQRRLGALTLVVHHKDVSVVQRHVEERLLVREGQTEHREGQTGPDGT